MFCVCRQSSGASFLLPMRRGGGGVVHTILIEEIEEDAHVFEPCVQSLAVEWQHGVGGIADYHDAGVEMVWRAFYADKWQVRVRIELLLE